MDESPKSTPSAFICDLDGLLVDSERLHFEAYRDTLAPYGIELTEAMFIEGWLSGSHYGTRYYLKLAGYDEKAIQKAREDKSQLFRKYAKGRLGFMPGADLFLKRVGKNGIPCAVGTGGYRVEYDFCAKEIGLGTYIKTSVCGDEVAKNKPAPDIFLKCAEKLEVYPSQCLVLGNSDVDLSAAIAAGMTCWIIPSRYTLTQDFSKADRVLSGLDAF